MQESLETPHKEQSLTEDKEVAMPATTLATEAEAHLPESGEILLEDSRKTMDQILELFEESGEAERERQFAESHYVDLDKEQLEYALVTPVPKPPEGTPVEWTVFIGGFSAVKDTYKQEMFDLARSGQHVLFLAPDKGITPTDDDNDYYNARAGALPDTIRNKASAVAVLLQKLNITNANIIGHSQGGAVAAALTGTHPNIAKRLILDNPAGLIGEDSVGKLLGRVADEAHAKRAGGQSGTTWVKQVKQIMRIPLFRASKEIPGIAHTDIRPILSDIQNLKAEGSAGPEIMLINSNNDQVFRSEDIEAGMGEAPFENYIDRWVMYANKEAGHGKFNREKPGLYPQLMDEQQGRTSVIHQLIMEKGVQHESGEEKARAN